VPQGGDRPKSLLCLVEGVPESERGAGSKLAPLGYIGITEAVLPADFQSNVVKLPKRA
jgi:hypothetical protein